MNEDDDMFDQQFENYDEGIDTVYAEDIDAYCGEDIDAYMDNNSDSQLSEDFFNDYGTYDSEFSTENQLDITQFHSEEVNTHQQHDIKPNVNPELIPNTNDTFQSMKQAVAMYDKYAKASGFRIRQGSTTSYADFSVRKKHVRCNRYGKARKRDNATTNSKGQPIKRRKSYSKLTGCMAMIGFHRDFYTGEVSIYKFDELHNHKLYKEDEDMICKDKRKLSYTDKEFIVKSSTLKIGASRAHKLRACMKGGYHNMPSKRDDYKNFWRKYVSIVGPKDAQCIVNHLQICKNNQENFFFKTHMKGNELHGIFWADETSRKNYSKYCDVISLDATYRTNKYNMKFVPITAINNHKQIVHVGAALLSSETTESYSWLLETLLEANNCAPSLILTDQDAALTHAISKVIPDTHHRLCMWHIMTKLTSKIPIEVLNSTDFKKKINKIVWDIHLQPSEFEEKWKLMLEEYSLQSNKWLHDIYENRFQWIPSYFRHVPLCGIMKTTSLSESSNSFFNGFSSASNLLVNFMLNFDTAISKQRHEERYLNIASKTTSPKLFSENEPLLLEVQAAKVYTRAIFIKVQKEIKKAYTLCFQKNSETNGELQNSTVVFKNYKAGTRPEYKVTFNSSNNNIHCSCAMFLHFGILCCHSIRVYLDNDITAIPDKYILPRWTQSHINEDYQTLHPNWGVCNSETSKLVQKATDHFEECLDKLVHDKKRLGEFVKQMETMSLEIASSSQQITPQQEMEHVVENIFGLNIPEEVNIEVPQGLRSKGCTKRTRMIGLREKQIKKSNKSKRHCFGCDKMVHHDRRNCPINPSKKLQPHKRKNKKI